MKVQRATSLLAKVVTAALILLLVALISAIIAMHFAIQNAEVPVPDLRGLSAVEAMQRATASDVELTIDAHVYSTTVLQGRIVSQAPAAGSVLRRESTINAAESLGPQHGAIADVTGEQEHTAVIELRRRGFDMGSTARLPDGGKAPGTILSQSPGPGSSSTGDEAAERSKVSLLVSGNAANSVNAFMMPDLTGQSVASARAAIAEAGLTLGPIQVREASTLPPGAFGTGTVTKSTSLLAPPKIVLSQLPPAGYRVDASTPIELTMTR